MLYKRQLHCPLGQNVKVDKVMYGIGVSVALLSLSGSASKAKKWRDS